MPKPPQTPDDLDRTEQEALYYMRHCGPVFVNKLAKRLNREVPEVKRTVQRLKRRKLVQRVTGAMVGWGRGGKQKHRNHTYYELTRRARLFLREHPLDHLDGKVNLRAPYKQA